MQIHPTPLATQQGGDLDPYYNYNEQQRAMGNGEWTIKKARIDLAFMSNMKDNIF
jgi:hypothetical protein